MKHEYTAAFGRTELRPLGVEDAERLRLLRNRNSGRFVDTTEITAESQRIWYSHYLERIGDYMFSVYHQPTGVWIGAAGIYDVNAADGSAEFGRLLIGRNLAPERGLGTDTVKALCGFAFRQLGLERLRLEVYHDNAAALITYLKAGFLPVCLEDCSDGRRLLHMETFPNAEN